MITTTTPTSWSGQRRSFPTKTRRAILKRDRICRACGKHASAVADHVVGHADAVSLGWTQQQIDSTANGQGLCLDCHEIKSAREKAAGRARTSRWRQPEPHPGLRAGA